MSSVIDSNRWAENLLLGDSQQPIIVVSHRRSGTHLMIDLLRRQFEQCRTWKWPGQSLDALYLTLEHLRPGHSHHVTPREACRRLCQARRPIVKTHSPSPELELAGREYAAFAQWISKRASFVYMVRDGREALCSDWYLRHRGIREPTVGELSDFLRETVAGMNRARYWAEHVRAWSPHENVLSVRYEDLINQPHQTLQCLGRHLQLKPGWREPLLPKPYFSKWKRRWIRLTGIQPASTAVVPRTGNDRKRRWPELLSWEDRVFFEQEAGDMLGLMDYPIISRYQEDLKQTHVVRGNYSADANERPH